ncbi:MAG: SDR family oxidoreductase [Gammaproteobacteria bacterium]|nr:SDR family oxidoreductase [Gammaproteobacteria bacterium]NND59432.1 SDR family oxidoreductase [Gammaproteobacteria bacterium]
MPQNVVITGANRGLGLELARSYANEGDRVFACCREPESATELTELAQQSDGQLTIHPLNVVNEAHRQALAAVLTGTPVDVLINNAGVYPQKGADIGDLEARGWLEGFYVNTIAPVLLAQTLLPNIRSGKRRLIASVSSKMGSLADNSSGGAYAYRSSKAALNMAMLSLSHDLRDENITVILLHPGWVKTDMGGVNAQITTDKSIAQMRAILDRAGIDDSGSFFDRDGSIISW